MRDFPVVHLDYRTNTVFLANQFKGGAYIGHLNDEVNVSG